jgi:DNA-binding transcriptional LysR family regulator
MVADAKGPMINIPTEILRTFVAVVDLRSFTRAAQSLGVTQPAVSAQIKRLQMLLGGELLDKSAPGVTLTPKGEIIVGYARRLLSINDQIISLASQAKVVDRLRIGIPMGNLEIPLSHLIAQFRAEHPEFQVQVCIDPSDLLLRDFRNGEYDLVLASAEEAQPTRPRWSWDEPWMWCVGDPALLEREGPVPIAVLEDGSLTRRLTVKTLEEARQPFEITYVGKSYASLIEAVAAGLGVACWGRAALETSGLRLLDHAPGLPVLPPVTTGIYVREERNSAVLNELADRIVELARPGMAKAAAAAPIAVARINA